MSKETRILAQRHDRWVDLIVIALVVVALALGWVVKTVAEGRTVAVEVSGLHLRYPAGWLRLDAQPPVLLQVQDGLARGLATTLTLQRRPLPTGAAQPLALIQQSLALERGSQWAAYRVLQLQDSVSVGGRKGMRITFAYVETNPDPFLVTVPVVMRGDDLLFVQDDQAYIFTLTSAEANYGRSQGALLAIIRSWK